MSRQKETRNNTSKTHNDKDSIVNIPVLNVRMMTDDEWNRLAYQNYLQRKGVLC